ncbi:hypothetical protein Dimus_033087, partial [Dionaea muscipula]
MGAARRWRASAASRSFSPTGRMASRMYGLELLPSSIIIIRRRSCLRGFISCIMHGRMDLSVFPSQYFTAWPLI